MSRSALTVAYILLCAANLHAQSYADPSTCDGCHDAIARQYARTGMAQTFGAVRPDAQLKDATFSHAASAETISVAHAPDGSARMERHQSGFDGSLTNVISAKIDYWFGSGNHARSYFGRTSRDELIELPLTWYSEKGGYWAMSPGYDSAAHAGFSRKATNRCMFCHNAYPNMPPGADRMDGGTKFPVTLPQGIDCQRCHGPGLSHVNSATAGRPAAEVKSLIVNPASLPGERRDEVCMQCHLEPTTTSLPAYLPVYGRGIFSYVPGEPLAQYIRYFDHAPNTGHDDKFEFSGAPYRLRKSACFTASAGALTCITCHDPHQPDKAESLARANRACVNCHPSLSARPSHTAPSACVTCHMPERRPSDAIHVTITDHYIRRNPGRALEPAVELNTANTRPYRGEVIPYYPPATNDVYTQIAQVRNRANLEAGIQRLQKVVDETRPANAEIYVDLADAWRHAGNSAAAIPLYREASSRDAEYWPALHGLGLALAATGDLTGSLAPLRKAVALSGGDSAVIRSLAAILTNMGRQDEALTALRDGIAAEPDSAELQNDLGTVLLRAGDLAGAEKSIREAVRLRPEAATMRLNLATVLMQPLSNLREAEAQLTEAIRLAPEYYGAHLKLGEIFLTTQRPAEALPHLRQAAGSPDTDLAEQAKALMKRTAP